MRAYNKGTYLLVLVAHSVDIILNNLPSNKLARSRNIGIRCYYMFEKICLVFLCVVIVSRDTGAGRTHQARRRVSCYPSQIMTQYYLNILFSSKNDVEQKVRV